MKTVFVTGVSRGLGEALALALLARGLHVVGIGRRSAAGLAGDRYAFIEVNLLDVEAIAPALEPVMRRAAERPSTFACLVNNAAQAEPVGVVGALRAADVQSALAINLVAPIVVSDIFCRILATSSFERRIVNVSSGAATRAIPGLGTYSIAKAGLEMLTQAIASEQKASGIRAVTLRPGIIDTDMQTQVRAQPAAALPSLDMFKDFHASGQLVAPETAAARIVDRIVLGPIEQGRAYNYSEL